MSGSPVNSPGNRNFQKKEWDACGRNAVGIPSFQDWIFIKCGSESGNKFTSLNRGAGATSLNRKPEAF